MGGGSGWVVGSGCLWVDASMGVYSFACFLVLVPSLNLPRSSVIYDVLTEAPKRHLWRLGRTGGKVVRWLRYGLG